ncbi:MAG TPA: hypothetical protein VE992_00315 [Solirubrobacteraceae bacterium]|nr:hypothetical protein [Solirubrobacteraceae bacterium]
MSTAVVHEPDRLPSRPSLRTLFLHIPKTAGHSISSALGWAYPADRRALAFGRGLGPGSISRDDLLAMPYDAFVREREFATGHLFAADLERWSGGRVYEDFALVTSIREPLERAVSTYAYLRERAYEGVVLRAWMPASARVATIDCAQALTRHPTLRAFLRSRPFEGEIIVSQCEAVSGSPRFARARAALRRRFVGFPTVEYLESFAAEYNARVGGPAAPVGTLNASGSRALIDELDPDSVACFYRDCLDEVQLYHWAKRHWREHLHAALDRRLAAGAEAARAPGGATMHP